MALSASASSTRRGACARMAGSSAATEAPPPQPHTTVRLAHGSACGSRNINSGCATSQSICGWPSRPTYTRPAPPCSAALAASKAAPAMAVAPGCAASPALPAPVGAGRRVSPPTMATSPRLPLWLACAWCAAAGAPDSQAVGGSSPSGTARSSNQTVPQASRPCAVNSPGLRVSRLSVWVRLSVPNKLLALVWPALAAIKGVASGESRQPVSASSPLGTSTFRRSAGLLAMCASQSAMRPSGGRVAPMPSRASMHTSCTPS